MDKKKLKKIRKNLSNLRLKPNNIRSRELIKLAKSLGRKLFDRGHEPTYISDLLPRSYPISIPKHPGALPRFTAGNILDQLEQDIFDLDNNTEEERK